MMSHRIASALTVDADAPLYDHGEKADKPIPVPNARRTSDKAAAANAPPITAAQEMADPDASFETDPNRTADAVWTALAIGVTSECLTYPFGNRMPYMTVLCPFGKLLYASGPIGAANEHVRPAVITKQPDF